MSTPEQVLELWFGKEPFLDDKTLRKRVSWWFFGGPAHDKEIAARFAPDLEAAVAGRLDGWAATPKGRLALIIVLDQFSRNIHRGSAAAFAADEKAQALAVDGIDRGMDRKLPVTERMFFSLPLGHAEDVALQEKNVAYAQGLAIEAPEVLRPVFQNAAAQARMHYGTIKRFGRFPHRNAVLGRPSTPEEQEFMKAETSRVTAPVARR